MAITPSQWSHVLTIPESYTPTAATSGQTLVITESVIAKLSAGDQSTFWSNVQNGGGDIRICTDSAGTNQLPVEVVSLDNGAQTCVIWTRKSNYDGTGDLYVFIGKAGETQPAVTDPFGRNAVWVDYHTVLHLNDTNWTDSTGNGYDATGSASTTTTDNPFGVDWADITGVSDVLTIPTASTLNNNFLTIQAITKIDTDSGTDAGVVSNRWSTQGNNFFQITSSGSRSTFIVHDGNGENSYLGPSLSKLQPYWVSLSTESGSVKGYINGTLSGLDTSIAGDNRLTTSLDVRVGTYFDGSSFRTLDGKVGEVRITLGTLSPNYIATEYANQSDPATFYGTPTLSDTGGASTPVSADVDYTIPAPTFTADATVTLPQPIADTTFTIPAPTFTATGTASLPQPTADTSFTVLSPTFAATADVTIPGFNASVSFTLVKPTFSGTASVTLPNPIAEVAYTVSSPTFSVNADASLPQPSADVAFSVNSPQFAASATATEPGFNASVNFTVNAPTFSGNASATLPQPNADVNFTVSAPTFSVVAIVGGIAIIVDDETNITLKAQSTNIDLPALSNNLEI